MIPLLTSITHYLSTRVLPFNVFLTYWTNVLGVVTDVSVDIGGDVVVTGGDVVTGVSVGIGGDVGIDVGVVTGSVETDAGVDTGVVVGEGVCADIDIGAGIVAGAVVVTHPGAGVSATHTSTTRITHTPFVLFPCAL